MSRALATAPAPDVAPALAYPKRVVETIMLGLQDSVNAHAVKLLGVRAEAPTADHWRRELDTWFRKIGRLRCKNTRRPFPAGFYFTLLFDEPFGGVEAEDVAAILAELTSVDGYRRNDAPVDAIVDMLRTFHTAVAWHLAAGESRAALIAGLGREGWDR